jgi:hypothetical protein
MMNPCNTLFSLLLNETGHCDVALTSITGSRVVVDTTMEVNARMAVRVWER